MQVAPQRRGAEGLGRRRNQDQDDRAGQDDPGLPDRLPGLTVPGNAVVITCDSTVAVAVPGPLGATGARRHLLLPLQARRLPERHREPVPADDGRRSEALRHAGGHRPDERPADRDDAVHRQGQQALPRDHPRRGPARPAARQRQLPELRDRPRRPDLLVPDDRLHQVRGRDRPRPGRAPRSAASNRRRRRRTSRSCSRPAPCPSSS